MLQEHLAALKHEQVTARHREKKEINLLIWYKYYTDELNDINIDTTFKSLQVLGNYNVKVSY